MRPFVFAFVVVTALITSESPAQQSAPLVGVVLDPAGKPIAGARVEATRFAGAGYEILDLEYRYRRHRAGGMRTTTKGRFALQIPIGIPVSLVVDAPPYARWIRDDVLPGDELEVRLEEPATLRGVVTLPKGVGAPATLRVWNAQRCKYIEAGRTNADGTFDFARLPSGAVTISVHPDAAVPPRWQKAILRPGEATEIAVDVTSGRTLRGRVLDSRANPIPGAVIGEGWTMRRKFVADADGNYIYRGYGKNAYGEVHARAKGFIPTATEPDVIGDAATFDFELERGTTIVGQVVDAEGKAAPGVYVAAVSMVGDPSLWIPSTTNQDGRFQLGGIPTHASPVLFVRCFGSATEVLFLPPAKNGTIEVGELMLREPRIVSGVLMDGAQPAVNRELNLRGCNGDRNRLGTQPASWSLTASYVARRSLRTNSHGQFAFGDLPPGSYRLTSEREEIATIEVSAGSDPAPLRIDLSR